MNRWLAIVISLLPLSAAGADGSALGRLFFTPEQRATLDRQRQTNGRPSPEASRATLTYNGYIRRGNSMQAQWLNGSVQPATRLASPRLRVGDSFDPITGERQELLKDGQVTRHPGRSTRLP